MHLQLSILKDLIKGGVNSSAYYVHCFADELHLVVVAVAKEHLDVENFFDKIAVLTNVVCVSCKQKDRIQESYKEKVREVIGSREIEIGSGSDKEFSLRRAKDTCRGSYYKTLLHLVDLYPSVVQVLEYIGEFGDTNLSQQQAKGLQIYFKSFDFLFYLHLMLHILGLTETLSEALQRKAEDIVNAISLVKSTKRLLQKFNVDGFDSLMKKISSFCEIHDIEMVNMNEKYVDPENGRKMTNITYQQYYECDCFGIVMDRQIQELDVRFSEVASELLVCMAALDPRHSFHEFHQSKLLEVDRVLSKGFYLCGKVVS